MVTGITFGAVFFTPRASQGTARIHALVSRDRSLWRRCLLWQGWLLGLSTDGMRDPWTAYLGQLAHRTLEQVWSASPADV